MSFKVHMVEMMRFDISALSTPPSPIQIKIYSFRFSPVETEGLTPLLLELIANHLTENSSKMIIQMLIPLVTRIRRIIEIRPGGKEPAALSQ